MANWVGRGKGRAGGQPSVPGTGGVGAGGGRASGQPTVTAEGGPGKGGGRAGSQPTISSPDSWVGMGQGRAGGQPTIETQGGVGKGGGRSATQPTLSAANSAATRDGSQETQFMDPEGNFYFALEMDGKAIGHFMECSGLKTSTEVFELQEGGMNGLVHKFPGQSKWENITLRFGSTADMTLLQWRYEVLDGATQGEARVNGAIVVYNNQGTPVRRFDLYGAWPVAWEGPQLASDGAGLAIEMIEIAHHGIGVQG